ncbi:MAG: hypothetical protein WCW13_01090 [archaeon]|jgi:hypothetical protein
MSKFESSGSKNPGDGSRLPFGKKLSKWFYNFQIALTRDKEAEEHSVHQFGEAKLRK